MERTKTVIRPPGHLPFNFRELWQYRELFYFFTWRDIKVKYRQTYLGIAWALIQPLGLLLLFTFIFSRNLRFSTAGIRYEAFALSGLILWNLLYTTVSQAAHSMVQQAGIIKKIYFPRIIIPCSSALTALFDFIWTFILFLIFCWWLQQPISLNAFLYYPLAILLTLAAAFGWGTFLAALTVRFKDFRYVVPFALQFLFFTTQIIYPLQVIQQPLFRYLLALNPINAAIELFRIPFGQHYRSEVILIGLASAIIFIFTGLYYFTKSEDDLADVA